METTKTGGESSVYSQLKPSSAHPRASMVSFKVFLTNGIVRDGHYSPPNISRNSSGCTCICRKRGRPVWCPSEAPYGEGSNLESELLKEVFRLLAINGQIERFIRTLKTILLSHVNSNHND